MTTLACGCDYWTVSLDGEPGFTTEERVAAHESRHAPTPETAGSAGQDRIPDTAAPRTFDRTDTLRTGRNYLRQGDPCRVGGERGVFRFVAVVTNTATGSVWAEVVGPAANPRSRSFRTDRLRRVRRDTPTR